jgi:uncharacterized protein (TIGR02757 family)
LFSKKEDIEIAGFLAATIAWGQRNTILKNANKLMAWMDLQPHDFILNHTEADLKLFKTFVHRTFNGLDCVYFIKALQNIYTNHRGIEKIFADGINDTDTHPANGINAFRKMFFELTHPVRTLKHVSSPADNSAAKRISMYLRWMVRKDKCGVDFGIWNTIKPSQLTCPLDVHSGRVARKLGLLNRTQNDWKAVIELSENLKAFDANDPIKYDFSLFGLGVNEKF